MAESFSMQAITGPTRDALAQMGREMDAAILDGVRTSGREVAKAAKARVRVYGGGGRTVHIRAVKKARRAGVNLAGTKLGKGESVEGANIVVVGLLRDSITAGRPVQVGDSFHVKVYPAGPKAHLYARKIEQLDHFMAEGVAEVAPSIPAIHAEALARVIERH